MRRAHGRIERSSTVHTMADGQQQLCFSCDENVRLDGDFLCRSCKEEYRKCYECGERERNHPFKLCTVCYQRLRDGGAVPTPASTSSTSPVTIRTSTSGTNLFLWVSQLACQGQRSMEKGVECSCHHSLIIL